MKHYKDYAVVYAPTYNLGDDIQTLAAIDFLSKKGVDSFSILNRESLHTYEGHPVNLIMNGWFMADFSRFPPSNNIHPVFISFHIQHESVGMVEKYKDYFKRYEPIGCRDYSTVDLFKSHGISAYFTGCLTLYLNPESYSGKRGGTYFCDCHKQWTKGGNKPFLKDIPYSGEVISHRLSVLPNSSPERRLDIARNRLSMYAGADLVVTPRLHCALPCRALGTDCIFVHTNIATDTRFKGMEPILNGGTTIHDKRSGDSSSISKIQHGFDKIKI